MQRITLLPHVESRERPPCAADRVERASFSALEQLRLAQGLLHQLVGLLERFLRQVLQGQATERQRDAWLHPMASNVSQLERAAAEVPHEPVRLMETGDHAKRGEFRLALAGDHLDPGAADTLCFVNEG